VIDCNEWKTERPRLCKYGESKTTLIMIATVPHALPVRVIENLWPMDFWWTECA